MVTQPHKKVSKVNLAILMITISLISLVLSLSLAGCDITDDQDSSDPNDKGSYALKAKYQSIRSYPDGGGIFIVQIIPDSGFTGKVDLSLESDPALNAVLSKASLDMLNKVGEITIRPAMNVEIKKYDIVLTAKHNGKDTRLTLTVDMYNWENTQVEIPLEKRDQFKDWVISRNQEYSEIFNVPDRFYHTYPEILIVEHFTYLTEHYELRFCYHVMVPPDDWSMILIRKRGAMYAEFAARRESDGTVTSIPVSQYPILLNY